ncbi:MAG: hypothetical protein JKY95_09155 [Planctomycetaceae bacterium]|nr:hypothetical protein [Planctomycetaceae bacterium]
MSLLCGQQAVSIPSKPGLTKLPLLEKIPEIQLFFDELRTFWSRNFRCRRSLVG